MLRLGGFAIAISTIVFLGNTAAAQKYLKLQSAQDKRDEYNVILHKIFGRIYGPDVVLSVLSVPSFTPEHAAGVLKTSRGYEIFCVTPSVSAWKTEYHRFIKQMDANGREVPYNRADNLKQGLPYDYHGIKTRIQSRPVSAEVADRIKQLWQAKLLQALHPPPGPDETARYIVTDGVTYQYSMPLPGHGLVTAEGQLVLENTPVWLMGDLSEVLSQYATGTGSEEDLKKVLKRVEKKA